MKRLMLLAGACTLVLLLSGCDEARTAVVVKNFDNSAGTDKVLMTLSGDFFVPTYSSASGTTTVSVEMGDIRDVVLLDLPESDALNRYYLYVLEDTVVDGAATVNDQFRPVVEITPKPGQTTELYRVANTTNQTFPLNPDSRSFFRIKYLLPTSIGPDRPLYIQIMSGTGTMDFVNNVPDLSIPLTNPAELNRLCFFLTPALGYTYFAFVDMDASGTPTPGDYATSPDAAAVGTDYSFTSPDGGEIFIDINLSGIIL